MKSSIKCLGFACLVCLTCFGCASTNQNAQLQARIDELTVQQKALHEKIDQTQADADTCVKVMSHVHDLEAAVQEKADAAWTATKQAVAEETPKVEQKATDAYDAAAIAARKAADATYEAGKQWAKDHNFTSK
jgi:hypothetical protein